MEKLIVKLNEKTLTSCKQFNNCVVVPIIGRAGCRSQHFGNLVFWSGIDTKEVIEKKTFMASQWRDAVKFANGDITKIKHIPYQPDHQRLKMGYEIDRVKYIDDYNGELDEITNGYGFLWMDTLEVQYTTKVKYVKAGNYSISVNKKNEKLNFHFNLLTDDAKTNAVWLDLTSSEQFHTEDLWSLIEGSAYYVQGTVYSVGGAHHQNIFIGVFTNGCKLEHYVRSYKGQNGEQKQYFVIENLEMKRIVEE